MRALIFLASLATVSSAAFAQSQDSSRPALGYVSARTEAVNRSHLEGRERYECLVRKSNGRQECHTRAEWRRIAMQIENDNRPKR
ncbi:hypothetical protein OF829_00845 [Sphingomonas sp. LB-2]|uniref:hypothetical protein n=1 Tax=Sphingomonas caeni TaxID=2984949 RepID=UPI00222F0E74|nr:hypothetical protein [Sphingomonas caeni]MCW3845768.1 hypothetical protein [Sphingomonas caeni]